MNNKELKELRVRLKTGNYDGADVMQAWIAIDRLIDVSDRLENGIGCMNALLTYLDEDSGASVIKSEVDEAVLRMRGEYGV